MLQRMKFSFASLLFVVLILVMGLTLSCRVPEALPPTDSEPLADVTQPTVGADSVTATVEKPTVQAPDPTATPIEPLDPTSPPTMSVADVKLIVEPQTALATEPVTIRVENLNPGQQLTLRSQAIDGFRRDWEASGIWIADDTGTIDLTQHAAESGSYAGVDGMGLFWSMLPVEAVENPFFWGDGNSYPVKISAEINNQPIATITAIRENFTSGTRVIELREDGLRGALYYPATEGPHPAILLLGGSEGGMDERGAAARAAMGYATLTLGYHGITPMPSALSEIPLETFSRALEWLKAQPVVDPSRIAISGVSRGSEAALLTAIEHPEIAAVIVLAPSSVVWSGLDFSAGYAKSAWTRADVPLPFNTTVFEGETTGGQPEPLTPAFEAAMETASPDIFIPAEKINAPILLISGTQDQLWPSTMFANQIASRLEANNFAYPVENLIVTDAGHVMRNDFMPPFSASGTLLFGGTSEANALGGAQAWTAQLAFLDMHLGGQ